MSKTWRIFCACRRTVTVMCIYALAALFFTTSTLPRVFAETSSRHIFLKTAAPHQQPGTTLCFVVKNSRYLLNANGFQLACLLLDLMIDIGLSRATLARDEYRLSWSRYSVNSTLRPGKRWRIHRRILTRMIGDRPINRSSAMAQNGKKNHWMAPPARRSSGPELPGGHTGSSRTLCRVTTASHEKIRPFLESSRRALH